MSRRFRSSYRRYGLRGFTLMEAMVSLIILVIVMVVTLSLMFSMSSFAERQQTRLAPRQTSRQAIDYLGFYFAGAADMNALGNDPNALVTWTVVSSGNTNNVLGQVSYNNLTAAQSALGDADTDIITLAVPVNPLYVPVATWPGLQHAATLDLNFSEKCPDNDANLLAYERATNAINAGTNAAYSPMVMLVDSMGNWVYYQITSYQGSACSNLGGSNAIIHVVQTSGQSMVNIPSGHAELVPPVSLVTGVQYICFRVKGGNLQQRQGFFDPTNPDTGFSTIVEDVEDFQVGYMYRAVPDALNKPDVYTYNTSTDAIPATVGGVATNGVPPQAGLLVAGAATPWDITNVQGLRLSITSRSKALRFTSLKISQRVAETINNFRPAAEDRAKGSVDGFDHYRVTTTLMIRNRMLGS